MVPSKRTPGRDPLAQVEAAERVLLDAAQQSGGSIASTFGPDQAVGGIVFAYWGPHHLGLAEDYRAVLHKHGLARNLVVEVDDTKTPTRPTSSAPAAAPSPEAGSLADAFAMVYASADRGAILAEQHDLSPLDVRDIFSLGLVTAMANLAHAGAGAEDHMRSQALAHAVLDALSVEGPRVAPLPILLAVSASVERGYHDAKERGA